MFVVFISGVTEDTHARGSRIRQSFEELTSRVGKVAKNHVEEERKGREGYERRELWKIMKRRREKREREDRTRHQECNHT